MSEESRKSNLLGVVGAVAGILAALVAVLAAIFGAFIYIDNRYVSEEEPKFDNFKSKYKKRLDDLVEQNTASLDAEIKKIQDKANEQQGQMNGYIADAKSEFVAIEARRQESENIVTETRDYLGRVIGITYSSGNGPNDGGDNNQIESRVHMFEKYREDTDLRIFYSDNHRVLGTNKACRWEVKIDGESCASTKLYGDRHDANGSNVHASSSIIGYCEGIGKGEREISVWVTPSPHKDNAYNGTDCYTGWNQSAWLIEVMEIIR